MIALLLVGLVGFWILKSVISLIKNIKDAKAAGLSIVISPVNPFNPLWLVFAPFLSPFIARLPFGLGKWATCTKHGWNFYDRYKMHEELGKVFAIVTPSSIEVLLADAAASDEVFTRKREFLKPTEMLKIIEIFGPTVATLEGKDWQRHRRITATPFTERNNRLVWTESLSQAKQMLDFWMEAGAQGISTASHDTMSLALNVITSAGFGIAYNFRDKTEPADKPKRLSYRACLEVVLQNAIVITVVPKWVYSIPFLPQRLHDHRHATGQLQEYMVEMAQNAKARLRSPDYRSDANLLSSLVEKNEEARRESAEAKDSNGGLPSRGLTDAELYGNFFIYSFAGHETTAHTLAYAMYYLVAFPEWQEWIMEEVDHVYRGQTSVDTLDFQTFYPQLKRCLALMHETLRLVPPVLTIPKKNGPAPSVLKTGSNTINIPPNALVYPNVVALHTHPDYWGSDSLQWKPSRWIVPAPPTRDISGEEIRTPQKGTYIPWGDGPRVCPGKKFSQVEFVAVISSMLWKRRFEVVPRPGETLGQAQKRTSEVVLDSEVGFTLQMKKPESVNVRAVER